MHAIYQVDLINDMVLVHVQQNSEEEHSEEREYCIHRQSRDDRVRALLVLVVKCFLDRLA
jgi:hypothetical protein